MKKYWRGNIVKAYMFNIVFLFVNKVYCYKQFKFQIHSLLLKYPKDILFNHS